MTPFQRALAWRFVLGLWIVETPILVAYLTTIPTPDWKILLAGLIRGVGAAAEKWLAPSLFNMPAATTVSPVASALGAPTVEQPQKE